MIYVAVKHEEKELRVFLCVKLEDGEPFVKHFYLERREDAKKPWLRSKKIRGVNLEKYLKRFEFDPVEVNFEIEDAVQEHEDDGEESA